jgi:hypothetical protein
MEKGYPLIIVFYLDAEMMKMPEIIKPFADSVNNMLAHKESNALAFFIPTKGEERVECINPLVTSEVDMEKINKIIEDIKESFQVGVDVGFEDTDIIPDTKGCDCDGGKCNCDKNYE